MARPGAFIASLFQDEPSQWGLRGDPYLWREMRNESVSIPLPYTAQELITWAEARFEGITGRPISTEDDFFVERFSHGGMSSGFVSPQFWRDAVLPLLRERYYRITKQTRSPKHIGDFGEGLVTYALIRCGYEVAHVDHVGADLIAEKAGRRLAVSVKTRNRDTDTKESDMVVITDDAIAKVRHFAERFGMEPVFAQVVCHSMTNCIHLFMITVADMETNLKKTQHGYSLSFGSHTLEVTKAIPGMKYSSWSRESIDVL